MGRYNLLSIYLLIAEISVWADEETDKKRAVAMQLRP